MHVAVGVIMFHGKVLLSKRHADAHQGGKWEFPGGKVEDGEQVQEALVRELDEELGIRPERFRPLIRVHHDYQDRSVLLDVWKVEGFSGTPEGREGQLTTLVSPENLGVLAFPEANAPIVRAAQLGERINIEISSLCSDEYSLCRSLDELASVKPSTRALVLAAETFHTEAGTGWEKALLDRIILPVYLDEQTGLTLEEAWAVGFQGLAEITSQVSA